MSYTGIAAEATDSIKWKTRECSMGLAACPLHGWWSGHVARNFCSNCLLFCAGFPNESNPQHPDLILATLTTRTENSDRNSFHPGFGSTLVAAVCAISCGLLAVGVGEVPPDARIDITRGRLPDTEATAIRAHVKVLGGQSLKVAWQFGADAVKDAKPVAIHIHRVTGTRRVPLVEDKLELIAAEVNWVWEVPVVKGPARYEATLDLPTPVVLVIEATARESHEAALKALAQAKVTTTGATAAEVAALRLLGIKPVAERAATGATEAVMLVESEADGGGWRRELRFAADAPNEVVWASGAGTNDWRVRVPRHWIAPSVLATTEGQLRLVECLTNPPRLP